MAFECTVNKPFSVTLFVASRSPQLGVSATLKIERHTAVE